MAREHRASKLSDIWVEFAFVCSNLTVMNSDSCTLNSLYLWAVCSSWKGFSLLQRSEQGSGWLYSKPLLLLIGFKMTRHYLKLNDKERRKEGGGGEGGREGAVPGLRGLGSPGVPLASIRRGWEGGQREAMPLGPGFPPGMALFC